MNDEAKYILSRLDASLDDFRGLGRWVTGISITFASAVALAKEKVMIEGFPSRQSIALLLILILFVAWYHANLKRGLKQVLEWKERAAGATDTAVLELVKGHLDLKDLSFLYWARLLVPSVVLVVCWLFLADIKGL
jgi:Na+/H+ antiporter NhaC